MAAACICQAAGQRVSAAPGALAPCGCLRRRLGSAPTEQVTVLQIKTRPVPAWALSFADCLQRWPGTWRSALDHALQADKLIKPQRVTCAAHAACVAAAAPAP